MKVSIYSPKEVIYEGDAEVVSLPTPDGEISVLENHIPLITRLKSGRITLRKGEGFDEDVHAFDIDEGFARIDPHDIVLLV